MPPSRLTGRRASVLLAGAFALAGCGRQAAVTRPPVASRPSAVTVGARRVAFARAPVSVPSGSAPSHLRLTVPGGWSVQRWAQVPGARMEAWSPEGELLVSQPSLGRVSALTPGPRPAPHTIVSGLTDPQGLAFARLGGRTVLYVAESDEVDRYAWRGRGVGARTVVIRGLPHTAPAGSDDHQLKNVAVGPDGRLYVDIGSGSNASPPPRSSPPRGSVVSYAPAGGGPRVIATGVRNGDGMAFAPDGTLWTAVNERDQIAYPFHRRYGGFADAYGHVIRGYVNEHPPDQVARLTPGANLGWPYCDPDPAGGRLAYADLRYVEDQQTNPRGRALDCATLAPVQRGLPAHSAPLGFHFLRGSRLAAPWSAGAVVAVHGSWDRHPPRAPAVLWLPWDPATRTLGAPVTLIGGFQAADGTRRGRPVDAVPGPDGALYVSDDQAGVIYRVRP